MKCVLILLLKILKGPIDGQRDVKGRGIPLKKRYRPSTVLFLRSYIPYCNVFDIIRQDMKKGR